MKSMNFLEFQSAIERIRKLIVGIQLQDFVVQEKDLLLLFYASKSCVLHLSLRVPPVVFFEKEDFKLSKNSLKIPLALFMAKHFLRETVSEVRHKNEWGRRFEIHFDSEKRIEITLVPGFQNVGLYIQESKKEKKVFLNKPKDLPPLTIESDDNVSDFRSIESIRDEWYSGLRPVEKASEDQNWKLDVEKKIRKKTEAIEKIRQQTTENQSSVARLYELGEQLKYQTFGMLEKEEQDWLRTQTKEKDRESIFKKAKSLAGKSDGMEQRIQVLLEEIQTLNQSLLGSAPQPKHKISVAGKLDVATRKLEIHSGLNLYMGKNARDNVQLLKSSQPWEVWFHLKDYPSAYAITRRNKSTTLEHSELIKMAVWFAKECFKNHKEKAPAYIEVVYTECRYVKLLKGDKLGRVTFTNSKTLRVPIT